MSSDTSEYTGREVVDRVEGIDLYSEEDEKVGHIAEVGPDYVVVDSGDMFDKAMYLPRTSINESSEDRWTISGDVWQYASETRPESGATSGMATQDVSTSDSGYGFETSSKTEQRQDTQSSDEGSQRIQLHEEELQAQKTSREAGEVVVTKDVVEETRTIEVPVTREEVRVERRPASGEATGDDAFSGDTIRVPLMEEQVEVRKVPRAVEEVVISKTQTQDTERVEDTVRKERLNVDDPSGQLKDDQSR